MLKAIFWDNDGVLVDTEVLYFQANKTILAGIGVQLTLQKYRTISLDQGQSVVDLARSRGYDDEGIIQLRKKRDTCYIQLLKKGIRIFPDVTETLQVLHRRVSMGLVTSSPRIYFDIIHQQTNFLPLFEWIITREDYQHAKPDPEPYLLALRKSGLNSDECVVIEDTTRGLESAKAAKIPCIIIPNEYTKNQHFPGARAVLLNIRDLIPFLKI